MDFLASDTVPRDVDSMQDGWSFLGWYHLKIQQVMAENVKVRPGDRRDGIDQRDGTTQQAW